MKSSASNLFSPIPEGYLPNKILIIRLHSAGDVAITFPCCAGLKYLYKDTKIDYLSSEEFSELPLSIDIFDKVFAIDLELFGINTFSQKIKRYFRTLKIVKLLTENNYDVILDLQNNRISRLIRKKLKPHYYGEFDIISPQTAGKRTLQTFIQTGFKIEPSYKIKIKSELLTRAQDILLENGWDKKKKLFLLNPAGLWNTRNWPIENYVKLARLIISNFNASIVLLGDNRIDEKSRHLVSNIGQNVINLVNKTTLSEAFGILQYVSCTVSEDSGLMHMAWVSGIPTVALLGSSRADWTSPEGDHKICLNSSDLECGNCMSPECKYNDVHCLTRYSPEFVFDKLKGLRDS